MGVNDAGFIIFEDSNNDELSLDNDVVYTLVFDNGMSLPSPNESTVAPSYYTGDLLWKY